MATGLRCEVHRKSETDAHWEIPRPFRAAVIAFRATGMAGRTRRSRQRTNFHRSVAHARHLLGPPDCRIEVFGIDKVVAGELFLRLGEWAVQRPRPPPRKPDGRRGCHRLQLVAAEQGAGLPQFLSVGPVSGIDLLHLLPRERLRYLAA